MNRTSPTIKKLLWVVVSLSLGACATQPTAPQEATLRITEGPETIELSVPVSKLVLLVPKAGFTNDPFRAIVGMGSNPRYFNFKDDARHLTVSGWFEPASRYAGQKELWESNEGARPPTSPLAPRNVRLMTVGPWEVAAYSVTAFLPMNNTHVKAELSQAGTWIELHLSMGNEMSTEEQLATMIKLLELVKVRERP